MDMGSFSQLLAYARPIAAAVLMLAMVINAFCCISLLPANLEH